jgi:putative ABC transport system permease protein
MADWRPELKSRLEGLNLRPEHEVEIIEELGQHLDDRLAEIEVSGTAPAAARAVALADLDAPGELARRLAEILERRPLPLPPPGAPARGRWLQARGHDLRNSLRSLRRSPGFTAAVIVTLGLTIGPTSALLSVGNWLLWRPTPGVSEPARLGLATFGRRNSRGVLNVSAVSYPNLQDLRQASRTLAAITGVIESSVNGATADRPAQALSVGYVTGDFFETLGVRMGAGRAISPADDRMPTGAQVVVLSDGFARRAFGEPRAALDQRVLLNGRALTVVGVVGAEFSGLRPDRRVDLWIPGATHSHVNEEHGYIPPSVVSRADAIFTAFIVKLAPGASFAQAKAELDVLLPALAEQHPEDNAAFAQVRAELTPGLGLQPGQRDRYGRMLSVMLAVGGVLLLLGCANVANLMTMRSVRGQRERAIRLALGASRTRLVWLHLTEGAVLAACGGILGVATAFLLKEFIGTLLMPGLARVPEFAVPVDSRVLSATSLVSLACGLLASLVPAALGIRTRAVELSTRAGGRTITGARRLRASLATLQLALSLALVTASFLLIATLRHFAAIDLGVDLEGVTAHRLDASRQGFTQARMLAYYRDVFERVRSTPGWTNVSLSAYAYGSSRHMRGLHDSEKPGQSSAAAWANAVTAGYFDVLGIRTIRGRVFTDQDTLADPDAAPSVAVVSAALARRLFGDTDPIGRAIVQPAVGRSPAVAFAVIGVVNDTNWEFTGTSEALPEPTMHLYLPLTHPGIGIGSVALLVKSAQPIRDVGLRVEREAMAVDPTLPVQSYQLAEEISYKLRDRITFAWVLSMLGWLGLTLAAVGLAGILAQSVAERTREFGIRLAVGSSRARVFGLVLTQAAWIGGIGTIAGLALAYAGSRFIEAQLYGVTRTSPGAYTAAAAALVAVVVLASLWPARTATTIEPVEALRAE